MKIKKDKDEIKEFLNEYTKNYLKSLLKAKRNYTNDKFLRLKDLYFLSIDNPTFRHLKEKLIPIDIFVKVEQILLFLKTYEEELIKEFNFKSLVNPFKEKDYLKFLLALDDLIEAYTIIKLKIIDILNKEADNFTESQKEEFYLSSKSIESLEYLDIALNLYIKLDTNEDFSQQGLNAIDKILNIPIVSDDSIKNATEKLFRKLDEIVILLVQNKSNIFYKAEKTANLSDFTKEIKKKKTGFLPDIVKNIEIASITADINERFESILNRLEKFYKQSIEVIKNEKEQELKNIFDTKKREAYKELKQLKKEKKNLTFLLPYNPNYKNKIYYPKTEIETYLLKLYIKGLLNIEIEGVLGQENQYVLLRRNINIKNNLIYSFLLEEAEEILKEEIKKNTQRTALQKKLNKEIKEYPYLVVNDETLKYPYGYTKEAIRENRELVEKQVFEFLSHYGYVEITTSEETDKGIIPLSKHFEVSTILVSYLAIAINKYNVDPNFIVNYGFSIKASQILKLLGLTDGKENYRTIEKIISEIPCFTFKYLNSKGEWQGSYNYWRKTEPSTKRWEFVVYPDPDLVKIIQEKRTKKIPKELLKLRGDKGKLAFFIYSQIKSRKHQGKEIKLEKLQELSKEIKESQTLIETIEDEGYRIMEFTYQHLAEKVLNKRDTKLYQKEPKKVFKKMNKDLSVVIDYLSNVLNVDLDVGLKDNPKASDKVIVFF